MSTPIVRLEDLGFDTFKNRVMSSFRENDKALKARIIFLSPDDHRFSYQSFTDRPDCECHWCAQRAATGQEPKQRHQLNIIDAEDGQVKTLSMSSSTMHVVQKIYAEMLRAKQETERLQQSYRDAAASFKYSKMLFSRRY